MLSLCTHSPTDDAPRACGHLFESEYPAYHRRFTGRGLRFDYVCAACAADAALDPASLPRVCAACVAQLEDDGCCSGIAGRPEVRERSSSLRFEHRTTHVPGMTAGTLLDLQPVDGLARSVWIALADDGVLYRVDLDRGRCDRLGPLPPSRVDLRAPVRMALDRRGTLAAVVNEKGSHGVVVDLESCRALMELDRDDYHVEHCRFSVAFFEHGRATLLVHAVDWNRLEVTDPRTGRVLTARDAMLYPRGGPAPAHYLDYFHCALSVSPDGAWVADNGWVWHPMGVVRSFSLRDWVERDPFEPEDGASVRNLCQREYHWDGPLCWVGDRVLAVGGYGDDDLWLIPAARLFDVETGRELRWFPGPSGEFVFDQHLFASSPAEGTTVWDVETGERLHTDAGLCPKRYHRGAREFCTPLTGGVFQRSSLIGAPEGAEGERGRPA